MWFSTIMTENVTLLSNCGRESVEQIMKNYFMEFKRFFNISSTKNKICRLNLCHPLKSRINFKTIERQLNTVLFCSRQHMLCSDTCPKYKQEHACNRSCSKSWERKALPPVFWYRYHICHDWFKHFIHPCWSLIER